MRLLRPARDTGGARHHDVVSGDRPRYWRRADDRCQAVATNTGQSRTRAAQNGWRTMTSIQADMVHLEDAPYANSAPELFGAALFVYWLPIIVRWRDAYAQIPASVRQGRRITAADRPSPNCRWRVFAPLARLACFAARADITRAPWTAVRATQTSSIQRATRVSHIGVGAGTHP